MESSKNAHNKTPGATATGAETGGANKLVVEEDKVASTSVSSLDCGNSDFVRRDLHIPNTVDAESAMSTVGVSPSPSISADALTAGTNAVVNRGLMELHERDAIHGRHGAQKRQKRDLEHIPTDVQDTATAADDSASFSANATVAAEGMRELGSVPTFLIEQGMITVIAADKSSQANFTQAHEQHFSVRIEPNQVPQQNTTTTTTTTRDQEDAHTEGTATDVVVVAAAATRTISSSSTSNGELLVKLAATIVGNEMILDQQKEIDDLVDERRILSRKFKKKREVAVTGPKGVPVYAIGHVDSARSDSDEDVDDSRWEVKLYGTEASCTSIEDFMAAEIRVGGIMKATVVPRNHSNGMEYSVASFKVPDSQVVTVNLPFHFGTLVSSLGPVSDHRFLSWEEEFESSELEDHLSSLFDPGDGHRVVVTFDQARFDTGMLRFDPTMLAFDMMEKDDAHLEDTATDVVAATKTMPSSSTADGELLAQLAATIAGNEMLLKKKKEIDCLVDLTFNLKRKIHESREVTVTGPKGVPVYAMGHVDHGCSFMIEEEEEMNHGGHWNVELYETGARCSSIEDLLVAEIRVGGIMKATLGPDDGIVFTNMEDDWYDPDTQFGTLNLQSNFGRLLADVGPVSKQRYTVLEEEFDSSELEDHLSSLFDSEDGHREFLVTFEQARFNPGMLVFDY
jgi:hypothetical protein